MKAWRGVRQPIEGHSIAKCLSHCLNPALSDPQTHNLLNVYSGERAGQATHLWCIFEAQHYQSTERKRESFIWVKKKKSLHMEKDEKGHLGKSGSIVCGKVYFFRLWTEPEGVKLQR